MDDDLDMMLPFHYRDGDGAPCPYSNTGSMRYGCPYGCDGATEHYSNDGHPECEDNSHTVYGGSAVSPPNNSR